MAAEHKHIKILAADPSGEGLTVHFSDGTRLCSRHISSIKYETTRGT